MWFYMSQTYTNSKAPAPVATEAPAEEAAAEPAAERTKAEEPSAEPTKEV